MRTRTNTATQAPGAAHVGTKTVNGPGVASTASRPVAVSASQKKPCCHATPGSQIWSLRVRVPPPTAGGGASNSGGGGGAVLCRAASVGAHSVSEQKWASRARAYVRRTCGARGGANTCGTGGGPGRGSGCAGGGRGGCGHARPVVTLKPQLVRAKLVKKPRPSAPTAAVTALTVSASHMHTAASTSASRRQHASTLPAAFRLQSTLRPLNTASRQPAKAAAPQRAASSAPNAAAAARMCALRNRRRV